MAFPTAVNDQITDTISQTNLAVLGQAPATALSFLEQATAQALALAAHNATAGQQQLQILAQAVTARCVQLVGTAAAAGQAAQEIG